MIKTCILVEARVEIFSMFTCCVLVYSRVMALESSFCGGERGYRRSISGASILNNSGEHKYVGRHIFVQYLQDEFSLLSQNFDMEIET